MSLITLKTNDEYPEYNEFWNIARNKEILEATPENIALTDDWIQIWKPRQQYSRGGKVMWSNKLQKIRWVTMSEYYGSGIVD